MSSPYTDPRIVHAKAIKTHHRTLLISLITLYSRANLHANSLSIFNSIRDRNVVSWTALISAFSNTPFAFHHFISMLRQSTLPNSRTFSTLFSTCASLSSLSVALQLHSLALKLSCDSHPFTASSLVSLYCKSRFLDGARKVFDRMRERDAVCYASIINGLAQNRKPVQALCYFGEMRRSGVESRIQSVSGALKAVSELAVLEQCRIIHGHAVVTGLNSDIVVGTAMIDAYGKCGLVVDARGVFDELDVALSIFGWNALMAGYAQQGDKDHVLQLFQLMEARGFKPDDYTFLAVLTALYNSGLAEESRSWITKMRVGYHVEPGVEHYTCLIGALGRSGLLEEAEGVALTMPFEPDAAVWRVLLSTSAYHGNADMAWRMGQKLLEMDPNDDSAYVISANAFAGVERWDEVKDVRKIMKEMDVRKEGGRSWIEVKGELHEFLAADKRHERMDAIYAKLAELMQQIEKLGYKPVLDEVLHDVDRKEKKEVLMAHSEKLALAFGVLCEAAPPGKAFRIVKNLRICRDCHEAFKYFSIVVEREIIVRDVNRYHMFSNGSCNCGDFW
ncbi:pentatricopeptide repeat-containing protein At4g33170-like [Coffea eugenioides]|uniref:pentatricopeptide repeat-containing protein At4g33170-like n=1 Tax=Coffea eugenioides TaxID=49369 RepID=UPI000F6098B4|nr:pentatricopeptide repeat-containing protein At4g33170-like [Coffea eugenioides]